MSHASSATLQSPNPMKKKVIVALLSVVVGHVGVLFAISYMKVSELKKVEKEPLKVRFVQIREDAPPPPPPAEPVKPKVEPKPEPKPIEPPPVVKPKIIAEKPKPKVEKAQPVVIDDTLEKQKREQERLEQQREQALKEQQQREQALKEQQQREQAERDRLAREAQNKPRVLSQGQISWSRTPKPAYTNSDLQGSDRTVVVSVEADANGTITNVRIVRSSGIDSLDQKILRAVRGAKFKPYKENGVAYPFKAEQPFELKLNSNG
jgi:periplasmic protein TonB